MKKEKETAIEDLRAEDQADAIGEGFVAGVLPEAERRASEPSLEEPPPVEEEPEELSDAEKKLVRIHDILDQVQKGCDPADRLLIHEMREILHKGGAHRPGTEPVVEVEEEEAVEA